MKNRKTIKAESVDEFTNVNLDFHIMQFHDYTDIEILWLKHRYGIDCSIMEHYEDIEISSHFLEKENQASFHFSIPYYNQEKKMIEEPIFIIVSKVGLIIFMSENLYQYFNSVYPNKLNVFHTGKNSTDVFKFQFEFISDYFADITENLTRKIKRLANTILIEREFSNDEMDIITDYNFSNLLIKESLIETTRVFRLYLKSNWEHSMNLKDNVRAELNDLMVVSDYIQFNFDRLDDLKENVSHKIDLEQNHIFKMLTVATVCISLPTFIAGVYGMNFAKMPELNTAYGYPIVIVAMICSAVLPFIYFKRKKWL